MTATANIVTETTLPDGRIEVEWTITILPEDVTFPRNDRTYASGTTTATIQADLDALLPQMEIELRQDDLIGTFAKLVDGEVDFDTAMPVLNDRDAVVRYTVRRLTNWLNAMQFDPIDPSKMKDAIDSLTPVETASALDVGVPVGQDIYGKLRDIVDAFAAATHTQPEFDVFG